MHTSKNAYGTMPFAADMIAGRVRRLNELHNAIYAIPDDTTDPLQLARRITLYSQAQGIIGDLYSQAVYDHGIAYNARKEAQAVAEQYFKGTGKEKEAYAEQEVSDLRREEVRAEAEKERWLKAYNSHEQISNAIKHEYKVIFDDYRQGGRKND